MGEIPGPVRKNSLPPRASRQVSSFLAVTALRGQQKKGDPRVCSTYEPWPEDRQQKLKSTGPQKCLATSLSRDTATVVMPVSRPPAKPSNQSYRSCLLPRRGLSDPTGGQSLVSDLQLLACDTATF